MFFPVACSNPTEEDAGEPGDDTLFVPEGVAVSALPGGNGVLDVTALTLQKGATGRGVEVFAALKNVGDRPACSAAFSFELYDRQDQSIASGIGGLLSQHFYRLTDGTGAIAACVGPGDVTVAAVTDLPADLAVEDVRSLVYRCPYFALDVSPISGLAIDDLKDVSDGTGTSFRGTLVNELDVAVGNPSVTVFPVNRAGRPLGMAMASGTAELAPSTRWAFETNEIAAHGVDHLAYPAGALADPP